MASDPQLKKIRGWWLLLIVVMGGITAAFVSTSLRRAAEGPALPVLGDVRDFTLTDQKGRPFSRMNLLGHYWIADFIYTTCPDQCPMMSRGMSEIQSLLPKESTVQLVSISVDPAHDTPKVMMAYSRRYKADPTRWHFLTGTAESTKAVAESFNVSLKGWKGASAAVDHSSRLILVDPEGRIRGYYDGTQKEEVRRLIRDVSRVSGGTFG